jgi:hypothetical protein
MQWLRFALCAMRLVINRQLFFAWEHANRPLPAALGGRMRLVAGALCSAPLHAPVAQQARRRCCSFVLKGLKRARNLECAPAACRTCSVPRGTTAWAACPAPLLSASAAQGLCVVVEAIGPRVTRVSIVRRGQRGRAGPGGALARSDPTLLRSTFHLGRMRVVNSGGK